MSDGEEFESDWLPRGLDESLWEVVERFGRLALEKGGDGLTQDELDDYLKEARDTLVRSATRNGAAIGTELIPKMTALAVDGRRGQNEFVAQLRSTYGDALDAMFAIIQSSTEIGELINDEGRESLVAEVLLSLHARACLASFEVHVLLSNGLATGALARARTLHELSVVMGFIGATARSQDSDDIARRFLDHADVVHYRDAVEFQKNAEAMGYEPLTDDEVSAHRDRFEALKDTYGPTFVKSRSGFEWAGEATGKESPTFRDLEAIQGLSHERSNYRWASHFVHADARGMILNIQERQGITYRNVGPTELGIAEPAINSSRSLHDCSLTLLVEYSTSAPTLRDLTLAGSLSTLVAETERRFDMADEAFEIEETRGRSRS